MNFAMRFEAPEAMGDGTGGVPERRDVPEAMRWDLEAIYPSFEAWERAFSDLTPKIDALAGFAGRLGGGRPRRPSPWSWRSSTSTPI